MRELQRVLDSVFSLPTYIRQVLSLKFIAVVPSHRIDTEPIFIWPTDSCSIPVKSPSNPRITERRKHLLLELLFQISSICLRNCYITYYVLVPSNVPYIPRVYHTN